jgi:hypothetical protein
VSIEGRISVDAVFHDKDGDESLKIVSLGGSEEPTADGEFPLVIAHVTGSVGAGGPFVIFDSSVATTTYRNAAGQFVSFAGGYVDGVAFSYSGTATLVGFVEEIYEVMRITSRGGRVAVNQGRQFYPKFRIETEDAGTYQLVVWGH